MTPLSIVLEFVRSTDSENPFVVPTDQMVRYLLRQAEGDYQEVEILWDASLRQDLTDLPRLDMPPERLQALGERLRSLLLATRWDQQEDQILEAEQQGRVIEIQLISRAAEIYALPWELISLGESGRRLGSIRNLSLQYSWPDTRTVEVMRREGGRAVFAWCDAGGALGRAPAVQAIAIAQACKAAGVDWHPEQDILKQVTVGGLQAALNDPNRPISVLHLLCHGTSKGNLVGISLYREQGGVQERVVIDAGQLRDLLAPHADHLRLVVLCACEGGNTGPLGNALGSIAQTLHRSGIEAVVAFRYPLSVPGANRFTSSFYQRLLLELDSVEEAVSRMRSMLLEDTASFDWASLQLYARRDPTSLRPVSFRPYLGIDTFRPEDARFFFGRDAEVAEVIEKLQIQEEKGLPRAMMVSGLGKTSFVNAALIPALKGDWEVLRTAMEEPLAQRTLASLEGVLPNGNPGLAGIPGRLASWVAAHPGKRLLWVMEGVDGLVDMASEQAEPVVRAFCTLASSPLPVTFLFVVRADNIRRVVEMVVRTGIGKLDHILDGSGVDFHRIYLKPLSEAQLREVIEKPAERVGLQLEAGVVDRLIEELVNQSANVTLVSYTLRLLWERREGSVLSQSAYSALGGVPGAAIALANYIFPQLSGMEQLEARRLLVRLAGLGGGPQPVPLPILLPRDRMVLGAFQRVCTTLAERLIVYRSPKREQGLAVALKDDPEVSLLLAHEALARWPTLRDWVAQDRPYLMELAQMEEWVGEWKKQNLLLTGPRLGYAHQVLARHQDDATPEMHELVAESERVVTRRRRRSQLLQGLVVFSLFISVLFARSAWVAERKAEAGALTARNQSRMVLVQENRESPATVAALLREVEHPERVPRWAEFVVDLLSRPVPTPVELHGLKAGICWPGGAMVAGVGGFWQINPETMATQHLELSGQIQRLVASPDGAQMVAIRKRNKQTLLRGTLDQLEPGPDWVGTPGPILFSPDGTEVMVVGSEEKPGIYLWKKDGTVQQWGDGQPSAVAWGPSGLAIAEGQRMFLWSADLREEGPVEVLPEAPVSLEWAGADLLMVGENGTLYRRHAGSWEAMWEEGSRKAVSPLWLDGTDWRLVDQEGRSWGPDGAGRALVGLEGTLEKAWIGKRFGVGTAGEKSWMWSLDTGASVRLPGRAPRKVWFSADEHWMFSIDDDGVSRWDLSQWRPTIFPAGFPMEDSHYFQVSPPMWWTVSRQTRVENLPFPSVVSTAHTRDRYAVWQENHAWVGRNQNEWVEIQLAGVPRQLLLGGDTLAILYEDNTVEIRRSKVLSGLIEPQPLLPGHSNSLVMAEDGDRVLLLDIPSEMEPAARLWTPTGIRGLRVPGGKEAQEGWLLANGILLQMPGQQIWRWNKGGEGMGHVVELGQPSGLSVRGDAILLDRTEMRWILEDTPAVSWKGSGLMVDENRILQWSPDGQEALVDREARRLRLRFPCGTPDAAEVMGDGLLLHGFQTSCLIPGALELEQTPLWYTEMLRRLRDATPFCLSPAWREEHLEEPVANAERHFLACRGGG